MEMQTWRTDLWTQRGKGEGGTNGEGSMETYTLPYVKQTAVRICCVTQGAQPVLCGSREGQDGWETGGRFKREGTYVSLWLTHVDV